ncbi:xyloglucan endotransglycosylase precursor [Tripterygium wilfordii]|uniref:Xyloglucan endotransglycosylase n=1 Tax=Tripterygium wilfordii TaxID=458696 RepID=A0A7J7BX77_TRIWF|nr:xyloglucan endotransglycosylase precursor [Tripterygium wilfordii]
MAVPVLRMSVFVVGFFVGLVMFVGFASSAKFDALYQPSWASDHFLYEGELIKLKLDKFSGAGFQSKSKYMFGKVSIQIKLVEGDSAGTVTAFYVIINICTIGATDSLKTRELHYYAFVLYTDCPNPMDQQSLQKAITVLSLID